MRVYIFLNLLLILFLLTQNGTDFGFVGLYIFFIDFFIFILTFIKFFDKKISVFEKLLFLLSFLVLNYILFFRL